MVTQQQSVANNIRFGKGAKKDPKARIVEPRGLFFIKK
jgi:hypothetical protein